MDVASVKTMCGDGSFKLVRGSMVLMRGVWYGNLYKILGSTIIDECSSSIVHEEGGKYDRTLTSSRGKTMYGIEYWGISNKRDFKIYKVNVWYDRVHFGL